MAATACREGAGPATTVADSAGVRIVTGSAPDRPLDWSISPLRTLGGEESGPGSFSRVTPATIAVGPGGTIHVWDPDQYAVHAFDSLGAHLWSAGREGDGPGEFRFVNSLSVGPDGRTYVYDGSKRALVVLNDRGETVDQVRFDAPPISMGQTHFAVHAGGYVFWHLERFTGSDQRRLSLTWTQGADSVELVSAYPELRRTVRLSACDMALTLPVPGAPRLLWALRGSRLVVNITAAYSLQVYEAGQLAMIVRRSIPPTPLTDEMAERVFREWGQSGPLVRGCSGSTSSLMDEIGHADALQVLTEVSVDPDGRIWARRRPTDTQDLSDPSPGPIDVFEADGDYLGTLPPSTPMPITFLGPDRPLYATTDEFDVQQLVIGRLARHGTARAHR